MSEIGSYAGAELILGLVAPVGTDLTRFVETLKVCMQAYSYRISEPVRLSELTEAFQDEGRQAPRRRGSREYLRIMRLMDAGNAARRSGGSDVMALAAAAAIHAKRRTNKLGQKEPLAKHAHVIWSLKHPAEVLTLRRVYGPGFYLIGVVTEPSERREFLETRKGCRGDEIDELVQRDEHEGEDGQRTRDTFELADVFVRLGDLEGLKRFLRLVFGDPYETPHPDEHAMFLAFAAALRSSDLSRQVGAVLLSAAGDVIAVGTNDVPTAGGGLFWMGDHDDDRDLRRGYDTNQIERMKIVDEILTILAPTPKRGAGFQRWLIGGRKKLQKAAVMDITEYGRAVHAEMEALLSCARSGTSTNRATLYSTTFPCHNCAKHIIGAGIRRVVYVEPYPKSRAREFYPQSIDDSVKGSVRETHRTGENGPMHFEPFLGIGPRRFFDLFSIGPSSGYPVKRKDREHGRTRPWSPDVADVRVPLLPTSYIMREKASASRLKEATAVPHHQKSRP